MKAKSAVNAIANVIKSIAIAASRPAKPKTAAAMIGLPIVISDLDKD